ncbi:MAG: hypothetical protein BWX80_03434 [Candidatus Hydrogenedentes bacterium ADurb.Bin101]|nr:MAG: hypothetical protein BWX80_03434 [Candidatus Hydrogenedentes bacterium ADurb.Bin101]
MLVRFRDQVIPRSPPGVCAATMQDAAHNRSGAQIRIFQERADHGSGRCLAMGAAHHNGIRLQPHQIGQQVAAMNHRYLAAARSLYLNIVRGDGGGDDHNTRVSHMGRVMPDMKSEAVTLQPDSNGRRLHIRAGHLIPQIQQDFGQAAHADAAYTHKMHFSLNAVHNSYLSYPTYCSDA